MPVAKPLFVVLDANIIYSWSLNDYLLWIATPDPDSTEPPVFAPLWSEEIIAEVRRNVSEKVQSRIDRQLALFPEAMVEDVAGHLARVPLEVDAKDRHVVAAAFAADAAIIVTNNLDDFAASKLVPLGITVMSGDAFLCYLLENHPDLLVEQLIATAQGTRTPSWTLRDRVESLRRADAKVFADRMLAELDRRGLADFQPPDR